MSGASRDWFAQLEYLGARQEALERMDDSDWWNAMHQQYSEKGKSSPINEDILKGNDHGLRSD